MNVTELQVQLHQTIDTITDSEMLKAVYTLLDRSKGPYKPMSMDEYVSAIDDSKKQIKEGKYLSADDLEKESNNW